MVLQHLTINVKFERVWCLGPNGFHKIHYYEYTLTGNTHSSNENDVEALICVHGLTRNGTDYDYVVESILRDAAKFKYKRIICPDVVGRFEKNTS